MLLVALSPLLCLSGRVGSASVPRVVDGLPTSKWQRRNYNPLHPAHATLQRAHLYRAPFGWLVPAAGEKAPGLFSSKAIRHGQGCHPAHLALYAHVHTLALQHVFRPCNPARADHERRMGAGAPHKLSSTHSASKRRERVAAVTKKPSRPASRESMLHC